MISRGFLEDFDHVIVLNSAGTKLALFETISGHISKKIQTLCKKELFQALINREALGSTSLGFGIAIPHAKFKNLNNPIGFFIKLNKPIDFNAIDQRFVDLIFVLITPEEDHATHLRTLSKTARILRNTSLCSKIRLTQDREVIYSLLVEEAFQKAA
jgi:nitrogen PTS system EIIA component